MIITSFATYNSLNSHYCHDKVEDMIQEAVQMEPQTTPKIVIPTPSCTCGRARTMTKAKDSILPRIVGGIETKVRCTYHILPKHFLYILENFEGLGVFPSSSYFILSEKQISMDGFCGN